jgi:hypothetical protein
MQCVLDERTAHTLEPEKTHEEAPKMRLPRYIAVLNVKQKPPLLVRPPRKGSEREVPRARESDADHRSD